MRRGPPSGAIFHSVIHWDFVRERKSDRNVDSLADVTRFVKLKGPPLFSFEHGREK